MFGFVECFAALGWGLLIFWQWTRYTSMNSKKWYTSKKKDWMPPAWVFPVAWTLLYTALTVMMYYFTHDTVADSWQLIMGFTIFLVHIALNKEWSVAFWDRESPTQAFWILVLLMLPTSIVLYIPFIVDNQTNLYYIPVILNSVYIVWLIYAAALNYRWMDLDLEK